MCEEPGLPGDAGDQRGLIAGLRAVIGSKDEGLAGLRAGLAVLRSELEAERELRRRLELRVAELERRLRMDSSDSGTPPSKGPVGARERRRAERLKRDASERERRQDRKPGGQPGHPGKGLARDRIRMSTRMLIRRRSAPGAGPAWPARRSLARRGRRSGTCRSRGR